MINPNTNTATLRRTSPPLALKWHSSWYKAALKVFLILALPLGGPPAHAAVYLLLAAWSLGGPRRAIEALTLMWLVSFLNPGIYSLSDHSDLLRWIVIGIAFVSIAASAIWRRSTIPRTLLWLLAFVAVSGVLSLLVSYAPDVSLFKLFSFVLGAVTILLGFHLTRHQASYWQMWFLVFFGVIVLASFPLIISDVGYFRNGRGFQGLINHPQAYATFLGPFLAWWMALLFEKRLRGRMPWLLAGIAAISLIATQSRTGALAAIGALFLAIAWGILKRPGVMHRALTWAVRLSPMLFLGLVLAVLNADAVGQAIESFILKGQEDSSLEESFQLSRGELIEASLENFYEKPLTGIGFGVASNPSEFYVTRVFGLPVGAAVEKGFAIIAALEEVGIIGFIMLLALIGSLLSPAFRKQAGIAPAALALGALLVNFGEAIFFALGGSGLLVWLLFGAARVMAGEVRR